MYRSYFVSVKIVTLLSEKIDNKILPDGFCQKMHEHELQQ